MVGRQAPSQLPSRNTYRDDYYALIFNGKKNPSVPLDMGRYGEYAPHTVEYQIYRSRSNTCRGEAIPIAAAGAMHALTAPCLRLAR